jgi:hypothetical protein
MEQRLLGQDVTVKLVRDGTVVSEITAIGSFDESMEQEIKEEHFLGRLAADYSDVFNGYKGNLEFQTDHAAWVSFLTAMQARAQRSDPGIVFNVVRTDLYPNGESNVFVYQDVAWGAAGTALAGRKDFKKVKLTFACSDRQATTNQLL